jgi:transposase
VTGAERAFLEELKRQVAALLPRVDALEQRVAELQTENGALRAENQELRARLGLSSQNSSKPPSSDGPQAPRRPRAKPSGRRPGGQPGHDKHERELLPPERVDRFHDHRPKRCSGCGGGLDGASEALVRRHQVVELPPVRALVHEHRVYRMTCGQCGQQCAATLPWELRGGFGPRLQAVVALLVGRFRLSRRETALLFEEVFDVEMSVGSVDNICAKTAQVLRAPVAEVAAAIPQALVANADETGFKCAGVKGWLWCVVIAGATLFELTRSRGSDVARAMLTQFQGVLGTDRWTAYKWYPGELRQLCWAHLKRNFRALEDRGGLSALLGRQARRLNRKTFRIWHRHRDGPRPALQHAMAPVERQWKRLLQAHRESPCGKSRAIARELLKNWDSLWTFVRIQGVEPTNNAAERALRPAVLWRKGSFGTQSEAGARFVSSILTVAATCKQQRRSLLDYLAAAFSAHETFADAPRLLPSP